MRSILPISLFLLSCFCLAAPCWGQTATSDKRSAFEAERRQTRATFKTTGVNQLTPVPYVQDYPAGKKDIKLIRALKYSTLGKGNNCLVQSFLVKDRPEDVRVWYKQNLVNNHWSVQAANAAQTQILGRRVKDGANVHIMVSETPPKTQDGFKSMVQIRYTQWTPLSDQ
jgi:hypothetical protein